MRRRILFLTAVVGVAVALPGVSSAQVPTPDSVTGSGTFFAAPSGLFFVSIDAHSGPSGENPSGTLRISPAFIAQVTCLHVSGNRAIVGYFHVGSPPDDPAVANVIEIDDNGPAGSDTDTLTGNIGQVPTSESNCPATLPQPGQTSQVLTLPGRGIPPSDFVVVDAQPPTTYTQCRQGGWAQYGYTSHAQCIDAVHELARKKCIFERAAGGIVAFRAKYGLGQNDDHAMRHCVRLYTGF
jgi:hypothetical protein